MLVERFVRSGREESVLMLRILGTGTLVNRDVKSKLSFHQLYLIISLKWAEFLTYEGVYPTGGEMILVRCFADDWT